MKKTTVFLLITLLYFSLTNAQNEINVYYTGESRANEYNFNKFIFVRNFFADIFYTTGMHKQLNSEEMAQIIETVRQRVSKDNAIKFEIALPEKPNAVLVFSIEPETKDGPLLILSTNFDQDTRKFTDESDNHLVKWYFIKNDLVIYRKNLFSQEVEEKLIKENEKGDLAEHYMMDEIISNDVKIKPLIDEIFKDKNATDIQKLYGHLFTQEYYFLIGKPNLAEKANLELNSFFNANAGKSIPNNYILIKNMANTEYEIMRMLE